MIQAILSLFSGAVIEKAKNWTLILLVGVALTLLAVWRLEAAAAASAAQSARTKLAEVQMDLSAARTNVKVLGASLQEQNQAVEAWKAHAQTQAGRVAQAQARAEAIRQEYEAKALAPPSPSADSNAEAALSRLAADLSASVPKG